MKKIRVSLSTAEYDAIIAAATTSGKSAALTGAIGKLREAKHKFDLDQELKKPSSQSRKHGRGVSGYIQTK